MAKVIIGIVIALLILGLVGLLSGKKSLQDLFNQKGTGSTTGQSGTGSGAGSGAGSTTSGQGAGGTGGGTGTSGSGAGGSGGAAGGAGGSNQLLPSPLVTPVPSVSVPKL